MIGSATLQFPILAITSVYGPKTAGLFLLAHRLISLPTSIIASALGDVYRQRANLAYRQQGNFRSLFVRTLGASAAVGLLPALLIILFAPTLFGMVAGEKWRVSGEYARSLAIAGYFQFIAGPVDKGSLIVGATRYVFAWNISRLVVLGSVFIVGVKWSWSVEYLLSGFAGINASFYIIDILVGYKLSGRS